MPEKLHDTTAAGVVSVRINHPLAKLDVVIARSSTDLVPRHGKLGAAGGADLLRGLKELLGLGVVPNGRGRGGVQGRSAGAFKHLFPHPFSHMTIDAMTGLAPGVPIAAEIHVAILLDEIELEVAHSHDIIVQGRIDMPGHEETRPVCVKEGDGGREVVVMVDYVGKVGHGFVALVEGSFEGTFVLYRDPRRIDDVDGRLPAVRMRN